MRLYEFNWGIYPRRVLIYLAEKKIDLERVAVDVLTGENRQPSFLAINPSGTVPVLQLDNGELIRQSGAIVEYLEQMYPEPNLIGATSLERARTREFMSQINEAYTFFNIYTGHASPVFSQRLKQNPDVAAAMYERYRMIMRQIEESMGIGPYLCSDKLSFADCALFASAQFAQELYKEPIPEDCPKILAFYEHFATRESARVPDYPEPVAAAAPIPERPQLPS